METRFQNELKSFKKLSVLNPKDLKEEFVSKLPHKYSARAIIITPSNKLILINRTSLQVHNIIGGHIEEGESINDALVRECKEESGYEISVIKPIGYTELWKEKYKSVAFCFLVKGLGFPSKISITKDEEEEGHEIFEFDYLEALDVLNNELKNTKNSSVERSIIYLKEAKKYLENMVK